MSYRSVVGKRVGVIVFAAITACVLAPIASCLDATELVIDVTTNADCLIIGPRGALIQVGPPSSLPTTSVTTNTCTLADGTTHADMGSIVVLPSGAIDESVAINVVASVNAGFNTADCMPADPGKPCIYARRQISFLPHARVYLPIELNALCVGVVCPEGFTCGPDGSCISDTIDPHCDGPCPPTDDGGGLPDISIQPDVPVADVIKDVPWIPDVSTDAPCGGMICNNQCVPILTDPQNCGACGFDCSNGTCANGTCRLDKIGVDSGFTSLLGTCLALYNGNLWVSTASGLAKLATNGGAPSFASTNKAYTLASYPTELSRIEMGTSESTIVDSATNKTYGQGVVGTPAFMAMSPSGYVWSDYSKGAVYMQGVAASAPTTYGSYTQSTLIPVAMADVNVYWTVPAGTNGVLYYSTGGNPSYVGAANVGAVIVDDPKSTTPTLYVVINNDQIEKYDYKLAPQSLVATSSLKTLYALAWDGSTIYANGGTAMQKNSGSTMVTVATATNAVQRCIAVDSTAVYWLEQAGGVYKHAK